MKTEHDCADSALGDCSGEVLLSSVNSAFLCGEHHYQRFEASQKRSEQEQREREQRLLA